MPTGSPLAFSDERKTSRNFLDDFIITETQSRIFYDYKKIIIIILKYVLVILAEKITIIKNAA